MTPFSGASGDRRRRVLTEQTVSLPQVAQDDSEKGKSRKETSSARNPGSALARQPLITDLIPLRRLVLVAWFSLGLLAAGLLVGLHIYLPQLGERVAPEFLTALDLREAGSLGAWFHSFTWAAAALGALVVYSLRRHRVDDYQGRYRIWLWGSIAGWGLSISALTGLHRTAGGLLLLATGQGTWANGAAWWLGGGGLILGWILFRTASEMRASRLAATVLTLAVGCWLGALAAQLNLFPAAAQPWAVPAGAGLALMGNLLLVLALVSYARHAILDAQGLLPTRTSQKAEQTETTRQRKKTKPASAEATADAPPAEKEKPVLKMAARAREPEPTKREQPSPTKPSSKPTVWTNGSEPDDDEVPNQKLNKAERRRMRKERLEQSRAA